MAWIQIRTTDVLFGPDRSTHYLQMVSEDDTSMQNVNYSVGAPERICRELPYLNAPLLCKSRGPTLKLVHLT